LFIYVFQQEKITRLFCLAIIIITASGRLIRNIFHPRESCLFLFIYVFQQQIMPAFLFDYCYYYLFMQFG